MTSLKIKLHLGCGKRVLVGYKHIDLSDYPHIDYKHDIRTLPMFEDNSVDLIYASHVLEYFDREEVLMVLKEWYRVLKEGGVVRLAVPDFEALVDNYKIYNKLNDIVGPLFGRWKVVEGTCVYHKTAYDWKTLLDLLKSIGFMDVRRWFPEEVFVGELEGYDDFSKAYKDGKLISLNVESVK